MPLAPITLTLLPKRKHCYQFSVQSSDIVLYVYMAVCVHKKINGTLVHVKNLFLNKMNHILCYFANSFFI